MIAPSHVPGAGAQDWLLANRRRECDSPLIFVINYAPHQSQCRVRLPIANLREWC